MVLQEIYTNVMLLNMLKPRVLPLTSRPMCSSHPNLALKSPDKSKIDVSQMDCSAKKLLIHEHRYIYPRKCLNNVKLPEALTLLQKKRSANICLSWKG